jgi:hypothetical protein
MTRPVFNDILSAPGFFEAIRLLLQLKPGATLWAGIPCSSFVWISRSGTKRSATNPLGDETNPKVASANIILARMVLLFMLACARGVYFCVEQPGTSVMLSFPLLQQLLDRLGQATLGRLGQPTLAFTERFWMGPYGASSLKRTQVFGSAYFLASAVRNHLVRKQMLKYSSKGVTTRTVSPTGRMQVRGGPKLKGTQAYPKNFGRVVARAMLSGQAMPDFRSKLAASLPKARSWGGEAIFTQANLLPLKQFLSQEIQAGRFKPRQKWG